jgi:hypothetical protein
MNYFNLINLGLTPPQALGLVLVEGCLRVLISSTWVQYTLKMVF